MSPRWLALAPHTDSLAQGKRFTRLVQNGKERQECVVNVSNKDSSEFLTDILAVLYVSLKGNFCPKLLSYLCQQAGGRKNHDTVENFNSILNTVFC